MISIWLWIIGLSSMVWITNIFPEKRSETNSYRINDATIYESSIGDFTLNSGLSFIDSAKTCADCHNDLLEDETVHAPAKKDCQRCHVSNGKEHPLENVVGFTLKNDVPGLCYECHDSKAEEEFVHDPSQKGECLKCHDIHHSPNLYLVKANPVASLCYECHDLKIPKENMIHGAVKDGECAACHNPHQASNKTFLKTTKLDRLCRSCHKSIRKELKKDHVHNPFKKKDCFACHNGHSSKEAHLSDMKPQDLCLSCHDDIHNEISGANLVHGAINEKESCLNCHTPHASDEAHVLKGKEMEICLSCHDKTIRTESGLIAAVGQQLKEGNTIHGAIEKKGCTGCHRPHTSKEGNLLSLPYPTRNYTKATVENFELCFTCHDKKLFESPTTETATNFRDGNQNLHYLHIKGDRGRNCNLCHDMHGAGNKNLIRTNTMFGKWDMPIQYEVLKNGGSCLTGCHDKQSYERKAAVLDSVRIN